MGLSKNAPVLTTYRERGIAKQSAWQAVDRAMTPVAGEMQERFVEVRVLEAPPLDAGTSEIGSKVFEGGLAAHKTWLRNRAK